MFPEYLTTLLQIVEYYNIYIGQYRGGVALAPQGDQWWASGPDLSARALRYHHKSYFLFQSDRCAKL